jgi:hypothetical protein
VNDILEVKASISIDDAGTITGNAWPFGSPDSVGDIITKGAFNVASADLPLLLAHDTSRPIRSAFALAVMLHLPWSITSSRIVATASCSGVDPTGKRSALIATPHGSKGRKSVRHAHHEH